MIALVILFSAVALLIIMVLKLRIPAFISLLAVALVSGLALGGAPADVLDSVQSGMGGTLGFVAVVVGLGALLGGMLELSGGIRAIASTIMARISQGKIPWALGMTGFLVAIPVFFDVALIILMPLIYSLARQSGTTVKYFGLALTSGLVVAHAFIPPTPGPVAVAEIIGADLGRVIMFGALAGLPAMFVAGPVLARRYQHLPAEDFLKSLQEPAQSEGTLPGWEPFMLILLPLVLILGATVGGEILSDGSAVLTVLSFLGHPFSALLLTCLIAWFRLNRQLGEGSTEEISKLLQRSLEPTGAVVLVTGAGGAFKQVLVDSEIGSILTEMLGNPGGAIYFFAFLVALFMRVSQGSATVAMITAAGLTSPLLATAALSASGSALLVIAIASGATACSHVNDSGFWLVSRYFHMSEVEAIKTWTLQTSLIGFTGFFVVMLLSLFV